MTEGATGRDDGEGRMPLQVHRYIASGVNLVDRLVTSFLVSCRLLEGGEVGSGQISGVETETPSAPGTMKAPAG